MELSFKKQINEQIENKYYWNWYDLFSMGIIIISSDLRQCITVSPISKFIVTFVFIAHADLDKHLQQVIIGNRLPSYW